MRGSVVHFVMTMMMVVIGFTSSSELRRYDRSRGRSSRSRKEKKDDSNQPEKFDIVHVNDIYGSLDFVPGTLYSTIHHTRGRAHKHKHKETHTNTHTHTHTHTHTRARTNTNTKLVKLCGPQQMENMKI